MGDSAKLREVRYERYEYQRPEKHSQHTGTLLIFVYDIPHFAACGVFPPLHIANQILIRGKAGGGMSSGTLWEPFAISEEEYRLLAEAVQSTPISQIKPHARYAFVPMKFDHSFDHMEEWQDWFRAVCQKHRNAWHEELERSGAAPE